MHISISLSLYILLANFGVHINFSDLVLINTISTIIGYYVFFAPGGIGVREFFFIMLINYYGYNNNNNIFFFILILHRVFIILSEIIINFFVIFFKKTNRIRL